MNSEQVFLDPYVYALSAYSVLNKGPSGLKIIPEVHLVNKVLLLLPVEEITGFH